MQKNEEEMMCSVYFIILKLPQRMEEEMLFRIFWQALLLFFTTLVTVVGQTSFTVHPIGMNWKFLWAVWFSEKSHKVVKYD